jgi:hypothetical protein
LPLAPGFCGAVAACAARISGGLANPIHAAITSRRHLILSRVAVLPVGRTLRVHLALHVAVDLTWHFHTLISGCG